MLSLHWGSHCCMIPFFKLRPPPKRLSLGDPQIVPPVLATHPVCCQATSAVSFCSCPHTPHPPAATTGPATSGTCIFVAVTVSPDSSVDSPDPLSTSSPAHLSPDLRNNHRGRILLSVFATYSQRGGFSLLQAPVVGVGMGGGESCMNLLFSFFQKNF